MRCIDADALFREMEKAQWYNNADRDEIAEELVLNAPTIEPQRKKGKWIEQEDGWGDAYYDCSACGNSWTTIDGTPWDNGMKFCPNCGARMEGENEGD